MRSGSGWQRQAERMMGECHLRFELLQTKVRRDWHHHSRALHRRFMGQGGITGCRDDSRG
jgi:hypothetical protein